MIDLIGSLAGFNLYASPIIDGRTTISVDFGYVILKNGLLFSYTPSSISMNAVSPGDKARIYTVDSRLARSMSYETAIKEAPIALLFDDDFSTPRGAYEGGLIVLGQVELMPQPPSMNAEKPLDTRERTTLLAIIGALADAAKLDLTQHNKAGEAVAGMLAIKGVKVSGRTIGEHLRAVRDAMESRKLK